MKKGEWWRSQSIIIISEMRASLWSTVFLINRSFLPSISELIGFNVYHTFQNLISLRKIVNSRIYRNGISWINIAVLRKTIRAGSVINCLTCTSKASSLLFCTITGVYTLSCLFSLPIYLKCSIWEGGISNLFLNDTEWIYLPSRGPLLFEPGYMVMSTGSLFYWWILEI